VILDANSISAYYLNRLPVPGFNVHSNVRIIAQIILNFAISEANVGLYFFRHID